MKQQAMLQVTGGEMRTAHHATVHGGELDNKQNGKLCRAGIPALHLKSLEMFFLFWEHIGET